MQAVGGKNKNKTLQLNGMLNFHTYQHTTVGGDEEETITIAGVEATDMAFVQVVSGTAIYGSAACTANTLTVTFNADPSNDTVINVLILRP